MLTTKETAALVQGAPKGAAAGVKVKVTRAFCVGGKRVPVDTVIEVSEALARELESYGKAVRYVEKAARSAPDGAKPRGGPAPQQEQPEKPEKPAAAAQTSQPEDKK